jgi:antitoxin VapB
MEAPMNAHDKDTEKRRARLFRNGRSQAVRIPKEFEFEGEEVFITQDGEGKLTLEPIARKKSLISMLDWLREQGPIPDFPGDPGEDDLLPLDDVKL